MSWKLSAKQALQYFCSKIILFLNFIPFLILVASLIVGMLSFAYNYQITFNEALGNERVNFKLYLERPFKPFWVGAEDSDEYYLIQEKVDPNTQRGYFYDFMIELWNEDTQELPLQDPELLILGLGFNKGEAKELTMSDLLTNKLLKQYFQNPEQDLQLYNSQAQKLSWKIYHRFQTNNLIIGYFLNFIQQNKGFLAYSFTEYWNAYFVEPNITQEIYWQHLIVSPQLIPNDPQFYQQTPWTLRSNPANPFQIQKQVDWNNYPDFLKNRNFLYFSPKFIHDNKLKVGQVVRLNFDLTINDQPTTKFDSKVSAQKFLIAGTLVNANNWDYNKAIFFVPYQWITKYYTDHNLMPRNVRGRIYAHLPQFGNNWQSGQKFASQLFNDHFSNLKEPGVPLETETEWAEWIPNYAFKPVVVLFLVLAYFVSVLMIVLLIMVFYFITKQLITHQRQTLMFLKSLGVSNHQLSLLITITLILPLCATLIGGFFGGLLIQQMTSKLAFATTPLYWNYFNFSPIFFIVWIAIIFILLVIFYLINLFLIRKQQVSASQGLTVIKPKIHWWNKFKLSFPNNLPPKFKIGLSFVFQNLMQNFITYLLLTLTFSIILYTVEFKTSLTALGQSYEKWNRPYKSINYNSQLYLFSPVENQKFLRSYQAEITNNELIAINTFDDWNQYFNEYVETILNNNFTFNWQKFYLTKSFSLNLIAIVKDKTEFNKIVNDLANKLKLIWPNNPEKVQAFVAVFINLANQLKAKTDILNQKFNYNDGFNVYFGQVPLLPYNQNVWTAESFIDDLSRAIPLITFDQKDVSSKKHFGFDNHPKADNYTIIDNQNYRYLKVNISNYLATKNDYHLGQKINLLVKGLKNNRSSKEMVIPIHINKIIAENNVTPEIYTSQEGLFYYLTQTETLDSEAKVIYENLLNDLNQGQVQINNSVYDRNNRVPWGIQNLTLPIYHDSTFKNGGQVGTRLEDFYDETLSSQYFANLEKQIIIFDEVSQKALKSSQQFIGILNDLIIIFAILSLIIAIILTNLFLLENQAIIILFKAMGYQKNEIQWYLIAGYLIANLLAVGTAIGLSYLIFELTKKFLSLSLDFELHFIWSWQYILTFIGLGIIFWLIIKIAINLFIRNQRTTLLSEK